MSVLPSDINSSRAESYVLLRHSCLSSGEAGLPVLTPPPPELFPRRNASTSLSYILKTYSAYSPSFPTINPSSQRLSSHYWEVTSCCTSERLLKDASFLTSRHRFLLRVFPLLVFAFVCFSCALSTVASTVRPSSPVLVTWLFSPASGLFLTV